MICLPTGKTDRLLIPKLIPHELVKRTWLYPVRISKSTHLTRLLQTQDVLLAVLIYLWTVNIAWSGGLISLSQAHNHLWLSPILVLLALAASLTDLPRLHGLTNVQYFFRGLRFMGIIVSGMLIINYVSQFDELSRIVLFVYAGVLTVILFLNRLFLSWYYLTGRKEHKSNFLQVLIIGAGPRAQRLVEEYVRWSDWGVHVIGVLDPSPQDINTKGLEHKVENLEQIDVFLENNVVDEVIVCTPRSYSNHISKVAVSCEEHGVCLKYLADFYDIQTKNVTLEKIGNQPVLSFEPIAQNESKLIIKRVIDLLIVIPLLLVLAPLFAIVAAIIKMDSQGPAFFLQTRVGMNKRQFRMIKFRSMFTNAEERMKEIEHLNEADGPIFKIKNDPRVTRVGKFIRRTSIDELPQLFNVLVGHMSLIGPRPMSVRDVNQFSIGVQRKRFSVRPGLACLREVSGRSKLTFDQWLESDLQYIDEWSLSLDFQILLRIIPSVIRGDGAS